MSDKYLYRDIQTADRGRGYVAIDVAAGLAYAQAAFMFALAMYEQFEARNYGFDVGTLLVALGALITVMAKIAGIYAVRLGLRAALSVRDGTAHEQIDQDARYKTSSST